jgi:hypothetical protein
MSRNSKFARLLRGVSIVMMAVTAAFTLLSGAGTTCVALAAEDYGEKVEPLVPYKWVYGFFVLFTLAIGVMGVRAVVQLVRGRPKAYRDSLIVLASGLTVGGVHMAVSRHLRGASEPLDSVVYTTLLTSIIFLLLRIPKIWGWVGFEAPSGGDVTPTNAVAISLLVGGILTLTVPYWAGPSHTWNGVNYADAWQIFLRIVGGLLVLIGGGMMVYEMFSQNEPHLPQFKHFKV